MKLIVALVVSVITLPALAQAPAKPSERLPLPDGTVPMTNKPDGPAKAALPEQVASPRGKEERPGSPASKEAERIK